jgi:hypothetical protein
MVRITKEMLTTLARDFREGKPIHNLRDNYHVGNRALLRHIITAKRQGLLKDEDLEAILTDKSVGSFPDNPENMLEAILSCVNGELKQAAILTLDRNPQTSSEIRQNIGSMVNRPLPDSGTFERYCIHTLIPVGFVAQRAYGKGLGMSTSYFSISEAGERYGQPISLFSLRYAVDNNKSLRKILGSTQSSGDSRGPYNVARMLELICEGHNKISDIVVRLGINNICVTRHLRILKKEGFLSFDSIDLESPGRQIFSWKKSKQPGEVRPDARYPQLTRQVAEYLCTNQTGDRQSIGQGLGVKHVRKISKVLIDLFNQGLVDARFSSYNPKVHVRQRSEITAHESSYAFINNYLKPVRQALADNTVLQQMRQDLGRFECDAESSRKYLRAGIELYRKASSFFNAMKSEERREIVLANSKQYEETHKLGPRPRDLAKLFGWDYPMVNKYLRQLVVLGRLKHIKEGKEARYYVS